MEMPDIPALYTLRTEIRIEQEKREHDESKNLNRAMDWTLPEDEATTLAGLVIHKAQTIPQPGQVFTFDGYRFEILRRHRNKITSLKVTRVK